MPLGTVEQTIVAPHCTTPSCVSLVALYGAHYHKVYLRPRNLNGKEQVWNCELCGAEKGLAPDAPWVKTCKTCKKEVDKLVGLFVPHLCQSCLDAKRAEERRLGHICGMCRGPYCDCCC